MNVEVRLFKAFLTGAVKAARYPMNAYRSAELIGFTEKGIEVRIIEVSLANDSGYDHTN